MSYDPHRNIFYYYRGPSKRLDEDIIYDTQIEDNTTKAFINCLENSSNGLLNHFINEFDLKFSYKSKPQYLLQVSKSKSRPDAQIKSVSHSLYIESKVAASINIEQLVNHQKDLKNNDTLILISKDDFKNKTNIKHIKWSDIYKCFRLYKCRNQRERFILNEFNKYLEVIGLSDFVGFNNDDFDYFINMIDDYKPVVKDKVVKFSNKVYESISDEIKAVYNETCIGKISKNPEVIWFGIRKDQKSKDLFKHCNFTIEINSADLEFNTVIRDGRYNKKTPIGIFYRKMKNNYDEFINILKSLNSDYHLTISKRVPKSGKRIMPGNERWVSLAKLTLEIVTDETINYLLMMLKKIEFPGIHFGLSINRGDEILQKPEELIKIGKRVIEEEYKILRFLES